MRINQLIPIYTETIPKDLLEAHLYISMKYEVAIHLCACGCGQKTVTNISNPNGWMLTDNNGKITMRPSIGNFAGESPYHAHYYITDNRIDWL